MYGLFGIDYRVAMISLSYLIVIEINIKGLNKWDNSNLINEKTVSDGWTNRWTYGPTLIIEKLHF